MKIPIFHVISWYWNFVEKPESPKNLWTLCISTKFSREEISWNYGIYAVSKTGSCNQIYLLLLFLKSENFLEIPFKILICTIFYNKNVRTFRTLLIIQLYTVWKESKYGVFSGPYSVLIQENTDQKKLRIWTLVTQW